MHFIRKNIIRKTKSCKLKIRAFKNEQIDGVSMGSCLAQVRGVATGGGGMGGLDPPPPTFVLGKFFNSFKTG